MPTMRWLSLIMERDELKAMVQDRPIINNLKNAVLVVYDLLKERKQITQAELKQEEEITQLPLLTASRWLLFNTDVVVLVSRGKTHTLKFAEVGS